MFLPNFITSMISTVGRTNYRIMVQHPYVVLLPTFTFFSYQKVRADWCGGEPDRKIMFSKKMTIFNMFINGLCLGAIFSLVQLNTGWKSSPITFSLCEVSLPLFFLAILVSMVFMFMEQCCGSCCLTIICCNIKDRSTIFDPDQKDVNIHVQHQSWVEMEKPQQSVPEKMPQ